MYCINLDRRPDRWARTVAALEPHSEWLFPILCRVPAVDGTCVDLQRVPAGLLRAQLQPVHRAGLWLNLHAATMPPGAVGCALSHARLWRHIASGGRLRTDRAESSPLQFRNKIPPEVASGMRHRMTGPRAADPVDTPALILEDDIMAVVPDFRERLDEVLGQLPTDWDLCYLGFHADPAMQLQGLDDLCCGRYDESVPLPIQPAMGLLFGTFAYLLSVKGAARLLEPGRIFPLSGHLQLDSALSAAFPALSAWCVPFSRPLLYSPQSQAVTEESDVQCHYYGPVKAHWRAYAAAVQQLQAALDQRAHECLVASVPAVSFPNDDVASSFSNGLRRCVCIDFVDPGEHRRANALSQLQGTIESLREWNSGCAAHSSVPCVLVWYGEHQDDAVHSSSLCPECILVVRGSFKEEANTFAPGAGLWVDAYGPVFSGFVSLQAFASMELDQLLCIRAGAELRMPLAQVFDLHQEHDVYVEPSVGPPGARSTLAAVSSSYCSSGQVPHERATDTGEALRISAAFANNGNLFLYNRRSWLKVARWCGDMFQVWMRLRSDLPCHVSEEWDRERLAYGCALSFSGVRVASFGMQCCFGELRHQSERDSALVATPSDVDEIARGDHGADSDPYAVEWVPVD